MNLGVSKDRGDNTSVFFSGVVFNPCSGSGDMETEYDYLFKIVLIGDAGVGKTSIVRRYTDGIFTSAGIPTIGVDFCIKTLQIGSSAVKVCHNAYVWVWFEPSP